MHCTCARARADTRVYYTLNTAVFSKRRGVFPVHLSREMSLPGWRPSLLITTICSERRVCKDIATRTPRWDRCRCSRAVSFLFRERMREIKKGRNDATKPFGFSDRSITISREYKCLREQPTDAVQFGVGPALPFNLVASPLLISFHRPTPTITRPVQFLLSLVRRSKRTSAMDVLRTRDHVRE